MCYKLSYLTVKNLFCSSFHATAPPFTARDTLKAWQEKNHPWLELSDVHRETTENIRVTVIPFYMGMRVGASVIGSFLALLRVVSKTVLIVGCLFFLVLRRRRTLTCTG